MITYHSLKRTHERTGLDMKSSARFIENAAKRGRSAETFTAKERAYLRQKEEKGYRTIVYNAFCFIYGSDGICITMFPLPKWFGKKQYDGKLEIRNAKKYVRFQNYYEQEEMEHGFCKVS